MKKVSASAALLLLLFATYRLDAQATRPQPPDEPRRRVLALLRLEDLTVGLLTRGDNWKRIDDQVKLLAGGEPKGDYAGLDKTLAAAVVDAWEGLKKSEAEKPGAQAPPAGEARRKFLVAVAAARRKDSPGFQGTISDFWDKIFELNWSRFAKSPEEARLLEQADADSLWIRDNLQGVQITAEAKENFEALNRALGDYQRTGDLETLKKLAADLRVKTQHCLDTETRADQPTRFKFDTIDPAKVKHSSWVVWAVPKTFPAQTPKRVGDPSTPVDGALLPGTYFFFAEKDGQQTCWAEHTVLKGSINPVNFLLERACRK